MKRTLHILLGLVIVCLHCGRLAAQDDAAAKRLLIEQSLACQKQAIELNQQGKYAEAIPLAQKALAICEQTFGERAPTASCAGVLAFIHKEMGNYAAAESLYKRSLVIFEKTLFAEDPTIGTSVGNLAELYHVMGNYAAAESLYKRSLVIFEKAYGPEHPSVATSLSGLALLYVEMGNYAAAEPLYKRGHTIDEKTFGAEHPKIATNLNNLANLHKDIGNYAAAEPLYKRSLAINEKTVGLDHPSTATSLNNLAMFYVEMGNYAAAEPLLKRSLVIYEKTLGPDHPGTATSLNNLASLYRSIGNYAAAEPLYKRSLSIRERTLGPDHPGTATSLNNLAQFCYSIGDYAAAEPLYKRSLSIRERTLGVNHPLTAVCLCDLGELYRTVGNYAAAEPLLKRGQAINEKAFGLDHPSTASSLNNLAMLYITTGNDAVAEQLSKRSLAIREKIFGLEHPDTAKGLILLSMSYFVKGDYDAAEHLCRRAVQIDEKTLGVNHPDTGERLSDLVFVLAANQKTTEALAPMQQAWCNKRKQRDSVFAFASEHELTAFADIQREELYVDLSIAAEHLVTNPAARRFAFSAVLSSKSATLEALSRRQADVSGNAAPELKPLFAEWQNVGVQLSKAVMAIPKPGQLTNHLARIAELEKRKEAAERSLARASARFASERQGFSVTLNDVARALPTGSAVVEFAKYRSRLFSAKGKEERFGDWNYIALILHGATNNTEPDVALVRLGSADKVEAAVRNWRKASAPDEQGRRSDKAALDAASQELAALVWNPIVPALAGCRKLYLSPDGELAFVSFAALPGSKPDSFVIDDYDISYVATGRDLVRQGGGQSNPPLLVGAPDFGQPGKGTAEAPKTPEKEENQLLAARSGISDLRSFAALDFAPLPGTRAEVESIGRSLQDQRQSPNVLTGAKADEATVKAVQHPSLLHLATHGFFLPDAGLDDPIKPQGKFGGLGVGIEVKDGIFTVFGTVENSPASRAGLAIGDKLIKIEGESTQKLTEQEVIQKLRGEPGTKVAITIIRSGTAEPKEITLARAVIGQGNVAPNAAQPESSASNNQPGRSLRPFGEADPSAGAKLWRQMKLKNPMHRSGIALAGANDTIRGRREAGGNDGILTAEEVAGMDLWGTKMVVISACESGLGEAKGGEGVFGLRRAFTIAGAQSLVMSLWSVSDEATRELMESLYRHLPGQRTPQRALLAAQREWIAKKRAAGLYPHPVHWASFVASGIGLGLENK